MSSLMEETYHYFTSTSWKCCLRCYYWNQIIPRNPLGLRIQNWELRFQKLNWIISNLLNKRVLAISSKACFFFFFFFLRWQEFIIVVNNCLDLHIFMPWLIDLLDCFIRLIIRWLLDCFSWQGSYSPILWRAPYIAYPPFFKFWLTCP